MTGGLYRESPNPETPNSETPNPETPNPETLNLEYLNPEKTPISTKIARVQGAAAPWLPISFWTPKQVQGAATLLWLTY